ncbi:MAG: CHAT domain-containing protein [Candidatus Rokubacteria bacterium]|nr:CHAT domain-containing protein [Candidatus Rokubacteria bacterium]
MAVLLVPAMLTSAGSQDDLAEVRRLLDDARFREAESSARDLLERAQGRHGTNSLEAARVLDLLVEALWRGGKASDPESRRLAERALRIKEERLEPDHPDLAASLQNLAAVLLDLAQYHAARPLYERALAIRERALGSDHPDLATTLNELAKLERSTGDYARARSHLERSLGIRMKAFGPDHPQVANSLSRLASLLVETGQYAEAKPMYERALAMTEQTLGSDHPEVARILYNLGNLLRNAGDYDRAKPLFERALALKEEAVGSEHGDLAWILTGLAILKDEMGDPAGAKPLLERALTIRERTLGPEHLEVASSLNNLALLLRNMGDYAGARILYQRSWKIREKALGPDDPLVAQSLYNLAVLLSDTGDDAEARPLYERALVIRERVLGPAHPEVASILHYLAALLQRTGDPAGARSHYDRALGIWEKALGPDHPDVAWTANSLANLLQDMGDLAGARRLFERALAIRVKALGPDHPHVAESQHGLANLLRGSGDYPGAKALYERALTIRREVLGPDHPLTATNLSDLSMVLAESGLTAQAFEVALEAEEVGRAHLRLTARALSEREALRYASTRPSGLDLALSICVQEAKKIHSAARRAWDALLRSRALILDEMAARRRLVVETGDPELFRLYGGLASARGHLAGLRVRVPSGHHSERLRQLLDEARRQKEQAERLLAEKSLVFRDRLEKDRLGLDEVAASLPPGSALVAYALYNRHQWPGRKPEPPRPAQATGAGNFLSYLAFVLRRGAREPAVVHIGSAEEVDSAVSRWAEAIREARPERPASNKAESAYRSAGELLRRKIWDPVAVHLEDCILVFVVPEGAINLVSLASLPDGETNYLIETGPLLHYLSGERDLVRRARDRDKGAGLLAIGGPDFENTSLIGAHVPATTARKRGTDVASAALQPFRGKRSACADFRSIHFEPLPATLQETQEIVDLWRRWSGAGKSRDADGRGPSREPRGRVVHLTGSAASEAAFKDRAPGRLVVHLATHGFFLSDRCSSAPGSSRAVGGLATVQSPTASLPAGENPLLLSGLALSGANQRAAAGPDEEDGILTAEEIGAMDLSGVEWAVLSACDTGIGEVRVGEGVFGLRRAFQIAGTGTLIMSLWPVEDETARQWMLALYESRFEKGLGTAEAVRQASLEAFHRRREERKSTHPFHWAAFVATGDWR